MNVRVVTAWCLLCGVGTSLAGDQPRPSYDRDVRPILAAKCFACHGRDEAARQGELRLDTRAGATARRDSAAAIVPGNPSASLLIERVTTADENQRMPPKETGKRVTAEEAAILRNWIAAGAEYERHWSLEPVSRPALPKVMDARGARSPIDWFVREQLDSRGLSPSLKADRHTLIRRVYLDLLGLLPSVEAADAFVADSQPDAYERLLDEVLAHPALGERWGRHWLDQARYADSHGYTNDNERTMWPYRDWVIRAINRDEPFDQFTIEQLAGDLLPEASTEQWIATGFHRNTLINTEGGVKADQFRDEQVKDRVDTTGGVWLGLTVGCAQCHDHKYDPLSQTEYYRLYAFFNSTADNNTVPPVVRAATPRQQARLDELAARQSHLESQIARDPDRGTRQRKWEAALVARRNDLQDTTGSDERIQWTVLELDGKSEAGATFMALADRSVLASGANAVTDVYQLTARSPLTTVRSVRLEALTHESLPRGGPGRADNGNFVLAEIWCITGDGRELRFAKAQADHSQPRYDVAGAIDGRDDTGWAINSAPAGGANHNRTAWFVLPSPLEVEKDLSLTFHLRFHQGQKPYNLGRVRLSISSDEWVDEPRVDELAKLAAVPVDERGPSQQRRLDEAFLSADGKLGPVFAQLRAVTREREQLAAQIPTTMVMRELDRPRPTHVQQRGDFLKPGEAVQPDVPAALPPLSPQGPRATRLDLARWMFRGDHPLTARVRVNRVWMRLFGTGLVETDNDFGTQGAPPTHPALLDWLAAEDMRQEWSTKRLLRQIAASATYRQASRAAGSGQQVDPRNRLWWRQNRFRVEGEIVRDLALKASGLLCGTIGGPSVYPPQPPGVYAFTQREKNWATSVGENRYRRGMYTFLYRSAPHPMLSTFDAPAFNQTCTRRDRSNTPLQSLTIANDEAIFEAAQALARVTVLGAATGPSPRERLEWMFRKCLVRSPTPAEVEYLAKFWQQQRAHFAARRDAARKAAPAGLSDAVAFDEAAAWVATARVLLNLDEFITRE